MSETKKPRERVEYDFSSYSVTFGGNVYLTATLNDEITENLALVGLATKLKQSSDPAALYEQYKAGIWEKPKAEKPRGERKVSEARNAIAMVLSQQAYAALDPKPIGVKKTSWVADDMQSRTLPIVIGWDKAKVAAHTRRGDVLQAMAVMRGGDLPPIEI